MTTYTVTGASCHNSFDCMKSNIQTQLNKNISLFQYAAMWESPIFYRKVSLVEKIMKNWIFFLNLNIRVPLESVNLFLHVFLCLEVILTMEHYIKLLTIFIWKFAIFWSWQLALWNLGQLAPASFFDLQQDDGHHVSDIYIAD